MGILEVHFNKRIQDFFLFSVKHRRKFKVLILPLAQNPITEICYAAQIFATNVLKINNKNKNLFSSGTLFIKFIRIKISI